MPRDCVCFFPFALRHACEVTTNHPSQFRPSRAYLRGSVSSTRATSLSFGFPHFPFFLFLRSQGLGDISFPASKVFFTFICRVYLLILPGFISLVLLNSPFSLNVCFNIPPFFSFFSKCIIRTLFYMNYFPSSRGEYILGAALLMLRNQCLASVLVVPPLFIKVNSVNASSSCPLELLFTNFIPCPFSLLKFSFSQFTTTSPPSTV